MRILAGFVGGFILGGAVMAGAQFYPGMTDEMRDMGLENMRQQQQFQLEQLRQQQFQQQLRPC